MVEKSPFLTLLRGDERAWMTFGRPNTVSHQTACAIAAQGLHGDLLCSRVSSGKPVRNRNDQRAGRDSGDADRRLCKRRTIEPQFHDTKDLRFGMGLSSTRIGEPSHRGRLLLVSAFATAALTLLGAVGENLGMDRLLKWNTSKTRTHSPLRQGCMLYELIPNMLQHRLTPLIEKFAEAVTPTGLFPDDGCAFKMRGWVRLTTFGEIAGHRRQHWIMAQFVVIGHSPVPQTDFDDAPLISSTTSS